MAGTGTSQPLGTATSPHAAVSTRVLNHPKDPAGLRKHPSAFLLQVGLTIRPLLFLLLGVLRLLQTNGELVLAPEKLRAPRRGTERPRARHLPTPRRRGWLTHGESVDPARPPSPRSHPRYFHPLDSSVEGWVTSQAGVPAPTPDVPTQEGLCWRRALQPTETPFRNSAFPLRARAARTQAMLRRGAC